jgi:hypothetical protein
MSMPEITMEKSVTRASKPIFWLAITVVVALLERILVVLFYQPVSYGDTPSYRRLAETVLHGFVNYDGTRTPGYPVFLALVGADRQVWLVQLLLGFITTLLLFYIGWKLTDKAWFGGLIALAHTLNLGQLFFESDLLTESLTTFLLVLTTTGVLVWLLNQKARTIWLAFLLGLCSTITLLVRPLFIYLPFLILIFLWLINRQISAGQKLIGEKSAEHKSSSTRRPTHPWQMSLALLIPVIVLLGGWVSFIHQQFGDWSLTTMTGYHLVQHTGNFFEYVPDEYASVRDTYIKYRDEHIAQYGTQTNTIWEAIPEMSQVSGYSFYALSRVLTRISIQLILEHPFLYAKSVASGWWMFWRTSFYWSADALKFPWLAGGLNVATLLQRGVLFLANLVFILASLFFMFSEGLAALRHKPSNFRIRFLEPTQKILFWFLLANLWLTSILQTLLDHGDNPRFLVPLQSLVVLWVALFFLQAARRKLPQPVHERQT